MNLILDMLCWHKITTLTPFVYFMTRRNTIWAKMLIQALKQSSMRRVVRKMSQAADIMWLSQRLGYWTWKFNLNRLLLPASKWGGEETKNRWSLAITQTPMRICSYYKTQSTYWRCMMAHHNCTTLHVWLLSHKIWVAHVLCIRVTLNSTFTLT